jgi:hypothetical protein
MLIGHISLNPSPRPVTNHSFQHAGRERVEIRRHCLLRPVAKPSAHISPSRLNKSGGPILSRTTAIVAKPQLTPPPRKLVALSRAVPEAPIARR